MEECEVKTWEMVGKRRAGNVRVGNGEGELYR